MSDRFPACPVCAREYAYEAGPLLVCRPMCGHEWPPGADSEAGDTEHVGDGKPVVKDAVGNVLVDGDTVSS